MLSLRQLQIGGAILSVIFAVASLAPAQSKAPAAPAQHVIALVNIKKSTLSRWRITSTSI
jgi:Mn2+/Fe2+ NRAMP family transporter